MTTTAHTLSLGCRVNEDHLAKVDAAAAIRRQLRSHFVAWATLEKADEVLRDAIGQSDGREGADS